MTKPPSSPGSAPISAPTSPPRRDAEERRLQIALAARALIVEKGLEGLRTRDIAQRVGINIATLHYHVPSKEALVALVAASIRDEFKAQGMARSRDGKSALDLLHMEFEDFRETVVEAPERFAVYSELLERARRDETIAAIMRPMIGYWHRQWTELLALGKADGSFRADIDPEAGATIIVGTLGSVRFSPEIARVDSVFAELKRAFVVLPSHQG